MTTAFANSFQLLPRPQTFFGNGSSARIGDVLRSLGVSRPLVVTTAGPELRLFTEYVAPHLHTSYSLCDKVEPDPPLPLVSSIVASARSANVDGVVALGGGSAIDTAKIVAGLLPASLSPEDILGEEKLNSEALPLVAIPTTAGTGSEVTPIAIVSIPGEELKTGIVSRKLIPKVAILDPVLTESMPRQLTIFSGLDALSHAVEAFVSRNASPLSDMYSREAIRLITEHLEKAVNHPSSLEARGALLYASHLAGVAFSNAGVTAAHAFAYPLGARYHLPHGLSVMLMLASVLEFSSLGNEPRFLELSTAFVPSCSPRSPLDAIAAINGLCERLSLPSNLRAVEIPEEQITNFATSALTVTRLLRNNRRPIDSLSIAEGIYRRALDYDRETTPSASWTSF